VGSRARSRALDRSADWLAHVKEVAGNLPEKQARDSHHHFRMSKSVLGVAAFSYRSENSISGHPRSPEKLP